MTPRGDTDGLNKNFLERKQWGDVLNIPTNFQKNLTYGNRERCDTKFNVKFDKTPPGGTTHSPIGKSFERKQWGTTLNMCTKFRENIPSGY